MEGEITMKELKEAVRGLKRNKAPGCNGLTTEFYVIFFERIKHTLLDAINESYRKKQLFPSALRGIITLIPKRGRDSRKIENLRPISLLCTDYKIIEKVLALRLRPILNHIINEDQKGFMSGRRAASNIRRVMEVIEHADKENLEGVIISVDFLKCFDRIETSSLIKAMQYFGIGDSYQQWTSTLYSNSAACVVNNGFFSRFFKMERSVKQGGPNSAYFFLILVEVLAIELRKNNNIQGFIINELMKFFGQYADDIDMYLEGTKKAINAAFETIRHFETRSGFRINYEKTTIYRIGSLKHSNAKMYTAKEVRWPTSSINVLGGKCFCYAKPT